MKGNSKKRWVISALILIIIILAVILAEALELDELLKTSTSILTILLLIVASVKLHSNKKQLFSLTSISIIVLFGIFFLPKIPQKELVSVITKTLIGIFIMVIMAEEEEK